jgi:hypothetical protein
VRTLTGSPKGFGTLTVGSEGSEGLVRLVEESKPFIIPSHF